MPSVMRSGDGMFWRIAGRRVERRPRAKRRPGENGMRTVVKSSLQDLSPHACIARSEGRFRDPPSDAMSMHSELPPPAAAAGMASSLREWKARYTLRIYTWRRMAGTLTLPRNRAKGVNTARLLYTRVAAPNAFIGLCQSQDAAHVVCSAVCQYAASSVGPSCRASCLVGKTALYEC